MNSKLQVTPTDLKTINLISKRDGSVVDFDIEKIASAVFKAFQVTKEGGQDEADFIARKVFHDLLKLKKASGSRSFVPTVEMIQDLVEEELIIEDFVKTAKSYILYRQDHAAHRIKFGSVSPEIREKVDQSSHYFRNPYAEFIFYQMYSRWVPELGRRETWVETIARYMDFMKKRLGTKLTEDEYNEIEQAIRNQDICPSMRLLWSAGEPAEKSNVWAYNCSYIAPTKLQDFGEIMYILMCGAGLGFTVESQNVQQLPQIQKQTGEKVETYVVADSKEGWADAFVLALKTWFSGKDIDFDFSQIRPAGARLQTAGGRASGPQPLIDLMEFTREKLLAKQGRRLSNIDVHDIICQIGLIVVAGGVRRSALISHSELDDHEMRDAKKGQFYLTQPQRSMANNSTIYDDKPSTEAFLDEWTALIKSKSGERGIYNRGALEKQMPERRWKTFKDQAQPGLNPCGEINLRSKQFCNLTSIVVRGEDSMERLKRKMELATILGTYQSTLTDFGYLSKEWKDNCDEERLLGVSITGYYDSELVRDDKVLDELREAAIACNKKYAERLGINQSTAITCVKPHGNSSQLLDTASGMHPRFAPYYVRRVRISRTDPLMKLAKDQGIPCLPEVGQTEESATTFVLEFPIKSPSDAIFKNQVSALDLIKEWKRLKIHFTEHNPSVTISVGDDEWISMANFLYENWDVVGGLSFLPRTDHVYKLAPYEEISKEEYEKRSAAIGHIDFAKLTYYEQEDNTVGAKEVACVSGACEI